MSRGAAKAPITYSGPYDPDRTYLPREVVTSGGAVYMSIAVTTGNAPPNTTYWLPMGGASGGVDALLQLNSNATPYVASGASQVADADFRTRGVSLYCEITAPAGTIVGMQGTANGSPETRVDGAVFGFGSIYKVRTAAGAVVASPAQWNWGDWTYSAALSGAEWVGSDAATADFAFSATTGVTLILGGTYLFAVGIYLP